MRVSLIESIQLETNDEKYVIFFSLIDKICFIKIDKEKKDWFKFDQQKINGYSEYMFTVKFFFSETDWNISLSKRNNNVKIIDKPGKKKIFDDKFVQENILS